MAQKKYIFFEVNRPDHDTPFGGAVGYRDIVGYQHAVLTIIIKDTPQQEPFSSTFEEVELEYQRHKKTDGEISAWYGESLTFRGQGFGIDGAMMKKIAEVFLRMEAYQKRLSEKGLSLQITVMNDSLEERIALLKKIGAREVWKNRDTLKYHVASTGRATA